MRTFQCLILKCIGLFAIAVSVASPALANTNSKTIAVFVEKDFPIYGGTPSLSPFKFPELFNQHGLQSKTLTATELAAPAIFNRNKFPVLVMPYGNTFPKPAYENLRSFHQAGGCLVMNGVPFTQPYERINGQWQRIHPGVSLGHDGIGTGGFTGPAEGPLMLIHHGFQPNPLDLREDMLPPSSERKQYLKTSTFPASDEVIPLIGILEKNAANPFPLSALVRHQCPEFKGARDVWIGTSASHDDEANRYLAEQLLIRGTWWCLAEKGLITHTEFQARLATLGTQTKPLPLPENLAFTPAPRPWGETYLPKSKPPAKRLLVVDVRKLKAEDRIALSCLQGLSSRQQPRLWLIRNSEDQFWLDWTQSKGHIEGYERITNWPTLFPQLGQSGRGAVVADPKLYRGDLLAVNVAACEDMIVATPELAAQLGLEIKLDLRGKFSTYAQGLRWVWDQYQDRLSHHLCDYMHPQRLKNCNFAYAYQWRGLALWIAGPVDEHEPGADRWTERRVVADIFAAMSPNIAIMGFPYAGEGVGPGEVDGVGMASRYAKALVCSDFLGNTCVSSGIIPDQLKQPTQPPAPKLEKDKIYIALVLSDGDNQNTWLAFFKRHFEHSAFGKFPLAFGMGPPIHELQPAIAQWYYEHATSTTEFIADVSGVGYMQPDKYGLAYSNRDKVFAGFLDWTARLMQPMGMRTVRTVGGGDEQVERFARALPFCHSIFADMGRYSGREGISNLTYTASTGMPVFRSVTSWRYGKEGFLKEVRDQVGKQRPAFVNGFVHCWTFGMDDLDNIYRQRDADMVFVTPTQLADLYNQLRKASPEY